MADVAALGLSVDSSQVKNATSALGGLTTAAKQAEGASKSLGSSADATGKQLVVQQATVRRLADEHKRMGEATGLARHEMINLSRQIQDVFVSLASGQSPFLVGIQQGTQMADIFGSSKTGSVGGAIKQIGSGILAAITPFRALVAVTVASGAAAYAAYNSWKDYALKIDDVARISGATSRNISALTTAAAFKGISNDEFLGEFRKFSMDVDAAQDGVGTLAMQFRFMGQSIGSPQQAFEKIADAVKRAGNDQERIQILQNAGLPITRQWIDLMSQGAAGIREAQKAAKEFGGSINDEMVLKAKAFGEEWNKLAENIKLWFRNVFVSISQGMDGMVTGIRQKMIEVAALLPASIRPDIAGNLLKDNFAARSKGYNAGSSLRSDTGVDQFYGFKGAPGSVANDNGGETDEQRRAKTLRATLESNSRYSQSIGILGDLATTEQLVKARSAELANQFYQTGAGAGELQKAVLNAVRAQSDMARVQQQASVGVYDFAAANKAAQETLQYWKDKGLVKTPEDAAAAWTVLSKQLRETADAASDAASNFPQLQRAINDATDQYKAIDQVATGAMGTLTTGFVDVLDGSKNLKTGFADMSKSIIRSIEEMIVKMYVIAPLMNSLKSGLGSFGSLFGGGTAQGPMPNGSVIGSANGNIFAGGNVVPFARGGVFDRPHVFPMANGGIGLLGEAGPEAVMPLRRGADGKLGVAGASGRAPALTIINQTSTPVHQDGVKQNSSGDFEVTLKNMVVGIVANDAANNGPASKALMARAGGFNGR